ncbi:MAG: NUDIX hydrolase [Treponema sp.]|nr:NUDIX hydrolase [Treponema sp.]
MNKEITTTESKVVYKNRWMRVREDKIIRCNGTEGIYGVVEKNDFSVIIPIIDRKMILVEQYRYPVEARCWEFPAGSWEDTDISPGDLARAELKEETGYSAAQIIKVGCLLPACSYSSQSYTIFAATGLVQGSNDLDPEEIGLVSACFDITEVEQMILNGTIRDATTVAAFGLARMKNII